ncbi:AMP-binding protein [Dactylosporangium roseum]|uniref:AMP-binding protein n=1 Tax=Dactylosporangium roseum TaxID=47989 RepID=A0ABY5YXC5_9ACTN|nr:AMP-binding protein [Dactylosporangium roseum]UWZ34416.1 AMP-binding protein [Dactylosporangium roseum]
MPPTSHAAPPEQPSLRDALLARRFDDAHGLRYRDDHWTWAQYVAACAQRAHWILARHRPPRPLHIGVLMDNYPEFTFLLGAAALAGATVVGLNPTRRGQELARDIEHTDCAVVITQESYLPLLAGLELTVPVIDAADPGYLADVAGRPAEPPTHHQASAEALFGLVFTSGTTGSPKAVRCTQGSLLRRARRVVDLVELAPADVCYVAMPLFHSNSLILGWAPAMVAGAAVVLRERFSASAFGDDVRRYGVTYSNYVGKPLSYILATAPRPDDAATTLRLVYGNEAPDSVIAEFGRRFGCRVIDGFGTTEGGIGFNRTAETPPNSVGVPRGNIKVLDPATEQECPVAEFDAHGNLRNADVAVGELVNVGGVGTFEGYYRAEAAMRERVRGGSYWSGDLGYRDAAGYFYFAGRAGDWLRVDGENLALAPIERTLARYPGFAETAVYPVPDPAAGDQVMIAVVPRDAFDGTDFAEWLDRQPDLGAKWAPAFVRVSRTLPTTLTNKLLRRDLVAQCWECADPVWWRPRRAGAYQPLDAAARERIRADFARHGRERLLRPGPAAGQKRSV